MHLGIITIIYKRTATPFQRMDDRFVNPGEEVILTMTIWRFWITYTYEHHHCVCHATIFPSQAWIDGKAKDIINGLYYNFES